MARIRHLRRAPIAEAVVDVRVVPPDGLAVDVLTREAERLAERYPAREPIQSLAARFGIVEGRPIPTDTSFSRIGVFLRTSDGANVAQFRTNGFAFSRLPQYTSWDDVFPEALMLWQRYREAARPVRVTRLAVRYVNRLRFALPLDLSSYLEAPPVIPESLPQALRTYLLRTVLADSNTTNSVIVTQALEPAPEADHAIILLDIDAYRDVDWDPTDPRIEEAFETLHDLKNRCFFGSITERTAEMYE